jgi:hypothetical protein
MAMVGDFKELSERQRDTFRAAAQIYRAYQEALEPAHLLKGGMHWKKIRGREYLYRYLDRLGHGVSLGPRSEETEGLFADYTRAHREAAATLHDQRLRLEEQARFCQAARLHRVPRATARILRRLEQFEAGRNLLVIGTATLYAYEFAAGVFLEQDLLRKARQRLTLTGGRMSGDDLLALLRQVDRSFAPVPGRGCRAANRDGFQVHLLKFGDLRTGKPRTFTVPGAREPLPPEAGNLQYLAASPKFSQVVIATDGWPATMAVPDPRAYALNKLWLSRQEDRDEPHRARDLAQALAAARLVLRYLPQYDYSPSELEMFPRELGREAEEPDEEEMIED